MADDDDHEDVEQQGALRRLSLWSRLQTGSRDLIVRSLLRAGGEPFGAPFEIGLASLTERVVRRFKQKGFFQFSSSERLRARAGRNKFTRHGAAPHRGPYHFLPQVQHSRGFVDRFLQYLRDNRFAAPRIHQPPPQRKK